MAKTILNYSKQNLTSQVLSYDTTFCLGNFYLSTLTMKNIFLEGDPIFPFLFNLHFTKREERHQEFFDIANKIFNLDSLETVPIVCDNEKAIKNSIIKCNLNFILCNNHLIRSMKRYLNRKTPNEISKKEMTSFLDEIGNLIDAEKESHFRKIIEDINKKFAHKKSIIDYFNKNLLEDIEKYSSKLNTKKYQGFKGRRSTSNQSESFNKILKSVVEWEESQVDKMILVLYHLQNFYLCEFSRATKGLGKYKPNDSMPRNFIISEEDEDDFIPIDKIIDHVNSPEKKNLLTINDTRRNSMIYFAKMAVIRDAVRLCDGYFTVESYDKKEVFRVQLFPQKKCSCLAKGSCYHLIASLMKINAYSETESEMNLSDLVKSCHRFSGKSGRKVPRRVDKPDAKNKQLCACSVSSGCPHGHHMCLIAQVLTWAPQNDVLGHSRVRAFLSHCGANSMYEVWHSPCPHMSCASCVLLSID